MEKIKEILSKANEISEKILGPIIDKIQQFLSSGEYFALGIIGTFVALLLLIGLIAWLKKTPKFFFIMLLIFGALATAALLL